jgi:hypothetical protein
MGWDGGYGFRHEADMGVVTSVLLRNLDWQSLRARTKLQYIHWQKYRLYATDPYRYTKNNFRRSNEAKSCQYDGKKLPYVIANRKRNRHGGSDEWTQSDRRNYEWFTAGNKKKYISGYRISPNIRRPFLPNEKIRIFA